MEEISLVSAKAAFLLVCTSCRMWTCGGKMEAEVLALEDSTVGIDNLQKSSTNCQLVKCAQELKCRGKMEAVNGITDKQGHAEISNCGEDVGPGGFGQTLEAGNVADSDCRSRLIKCMFCHSAEHTQVSGEMIHYFQGKPDPNDYNGGSHVIHSHKRCTEWITTRVNLQESFDATRRKTIEIGWTEKDVLSLLTFGVWRKDF